MSATNYPSATPQTPAPKKDNRGLIYGVLIAALLGTWGYIIYDKSKTKEVIQQKDVQYSALDSSKNMIQKEYEDALLRLDAMTGTNSKLDSLVKSRDKEIGDMKGRIQSLVRKQNASAADIAEARELIKQLNGKIDDYVKEIERLTGENKQLTADKEQLTTQKADLETNLATTDAAKKVAEEKVDIAIIETGLGGRLDSTNIIQPLLSIITNIGWDHTDLLGDTLPKIASEKAGIIKHKTPVVIGEYQPETFPVFMEKARVEESPIFLSNQKVNILYFKSSIIHSAFDVQFQFGELWKNVYCDLNGIYQQKNIGTILSSLDLIRQSGFKLSERDIREGLLNVKKNTGLMGRWQILNTQPLTVCDTGHNQNGIEYVLKQIAEQKFENLHMVIGMVKDKDIDKVLSMLPKNAIYYFTKASIPRAMDEKELQAKAISFGLNGKTYRSVVEAKSAAKLAANKNDMIFIGGSTFVVAEAI
ncbi:MAG: bifunctional folylpolyglutamate synthase/dihydrofolate synthase [Sphingobacteriales bacterium]|nr:MAG: bifunctional folylpolyglutamate synthase/dihydrofolate synthase [Sphingobacteriales bacterium]